MDGVLCCSSDKFDENIIRSLSGSVKIIATFSVGYEHIKIQVAETKGITVTNTPDVLTESTADTAILLLLAAARRAREALHMISSGNWTGWTPTQLLGIQPGGRRLGILGMGRIGCAVADRARAFGMKIHYYNRNKLPPNLEKGAIYHKSYEDLFSVSDFLSINCQMTPETKNLINCNTIDLFPKDAVIVNTSRGGVIEDSALIEALKSGRIAAAGLDVFEGEPNVNTGYFPLENAFIFPHIGSATVDTRNAMGFRALDNLDTYFSGGIPRDRLA
jgi:lactate dehydrogenase-like 2-hydroxyacid dehydrogenase